jgi:hypothetical protein
MTTLRRPWNRLGGGVALQELLSQVLSWTKRHHSRERQPLDPLDKVFGPFLNRILAEHESTVSQKTDRIG